MKTLMYLILSKFRSNLFIRILVFILIGYTVFTLNFTISRWYYNTSLVRGLTQLGIEDTLLYVEPREKQAGESPAYDYCFEKLEGLAGVRGLVRNTLFGGGGDGSFTAENMLITSSIYTSAIKLPMYKGQWFGTMDMLNGTIPCVISYNLRGKYTIGEMYEYMGYTVRIIGIAAKGAYLPTNQSGGTMLNLNDILDRDNSFFIIQNDNDEFHLDVCYSIVLESGADVNIVVEQCRNVLHNVANVFTYTELLERSADYNNEIIHMQGLIFAVMSILSLIGAGTCNLLLTLSDKRIFSIYYVNGFSWESSLVLTVFQNIFFLILPTMLGLTVYNIMLVFMHDNNIASSMWNWAISGGFLLLLFILTSTLPIITLRKSSPLNTIRKL